MGFRKILAALCIVAIAATGIGAAVFLVNHMNTVNSTPSVSSRIARVLREVPQLGLCQIVAFMRFCPFLTEN